MHPLQTLTASSRRVTYLVMLACTASLLGCNAREGATLSFAPPGGAAGSGWTADPSPMVLESVKVPDAPALDGQVEEAWSKARPLTVDVREAMGGDHPKPVVLRAMLPMLPPLILVQAARSFLISALVTFLPTFLTTQGVAYGLAAASVSIVEAAGVAGAFSGGWASDRWSRRGVLAASFIVAPLALLGFLCAFGIVILTLRTLYSRSWKNPFGDGKAGERIIDTIIQA